MSEANEFEEVERVGFEGTEAEVKRESARRTRRSFVVGGVAAAAGYGLWRATGMGPVIGRQPITFRRTFEADAAIMRGVFGERGLSPEYPASRAENLRLNGTIGIAEMIQPASWRLQVAGVANAAQSPHYAADVTAWEYEYGGEMTESAGPDNKEAPKSKEPDAQKSSPAPASAASANTLNPGGAHDSDAGAALAARIEALTNAMAKKPHQGDDEAGPSASGLDRGTPGLLLSMDDLKSKLPFVEHVTQFRCIEGWSQIVHWGGFRLRDFMEAFPAEKVNGREPRYVYMETPDGNYYGGYDRDACLHPQSLLVTHMGGEPLTQAHGAPLRLFMPIKYGYKQVKRIGLIAYTDTRPDDYWTKLGYDWYAGL
jgi:hypothetical protein